MKTKDGVEISNFGLVLGTIGLFGFITAFLNEEIKYIVLQIISSCILMSIPFINKYISKTFKEKEKECEE